MVCLAKASEEIWSTLVDSDSANLVCILTVAIFGCVSGQRTSCLYLYLFRFQCSPMKMRPRQAEKNEKASSLYRLRQSTIAEKMKRCVLWDGMWPRSLGVWGWSLYFPSYTHVYTWKGKHIRFLQKLKVLFWARVSLVQPRKTRWGSVGSVLI